MCTNVKKKAIFMFSLHQIGQGEKFSRCCVAIRGAIRFVTKGYLCSDKFSQKSVTSGAMGICEGVQCEGHFAFLVQRFDKYTLPDSVGKVKNLFHFKQRRAFRVGHVHKRLKIFDCFRRVGDQGFRFAGFDVDDVAEVFNDYCHLLRSLLRFDKYTLPDSVGKVKHFSLQDIIA